MCEKAFKGSDSFKIHVKSHTGEKSYQCKTCEKPFIIAQNLKRHKMIHTEEKPYECLSSEIVCE